MPEITKTLAKLVRGGNKVFRCNCRATSPHRTAIGGQIYASLLNSNSEVLRFEVKQCLAALHIKRHRIMFMCDHPFAVHPLKANCRTPPHFDFLSVSLRSVDAVEAVAES